jgi:dihydroorotate dehydrogenase (NAD+) catalytic subunit
MVTDIVGRAECLQSYDIGQSYDWNYSNAPKTAPEVEIPSLRRSWNFCGFAVDSPLGMPAGPLLNSDWIAYYGRLGFSVLTYKTVRSSYRACYGLPNLLPVEAAQLTGPAETAAEARGNRPIESWAISFGMPSKDPAVWREDVEKARRSLRSSQVLVVSVVASPEDDWGLEQIAADFARCAVWAVEAGAQAIEANLSCPNVCSKEGQLYTSPKASEVVSSTIRSAIGHTPLILKIGLMEGREQAHAFVEAVADAATALSTVNSISASVVDRSGSTAFGGLTRGIGGRCIRDRSNAEVGLLHDVCRSASSDLQLIGVGGISNSEDVRSRMASGAGHVQLATAAMLDPLVGLRIRRDLASR